MKPKEKACQGCDYIEAPILDESTRHFKEQLQKKHLAKEESIKDEVASDLEKKS